MSFTAMFLTLVCTEYKLLVLNRIMNNRTEEVYDGIQKQKYKLFYNTRLHYVQHDYFPLS